MKVYNSYQEAKIANQEKDIFSLQGKYTCGGDESLHPDSQGCHWNPCKPSEHLISVKEFFDKGHSFLIGDCFINQHGEVIEVGKRYEGEIVIMPDEANYRIPGSDEHCYILRACAMEIPTQTHEEKEALDMIDTTSKRVESLAKGDVVEWDGEDLPPVGVECEILFKEYPHKGFGLFNVLAYHGGAIWVQYTGPLENNGKCYTAECSTLEFRKPESQEQKAKRERDEYIHVMVDDFNDQDIDYNYRGKVAKVCAALYDAGYRKESK